MTPIQFVSIDISDPIQVFEEEGEIIILTDLGRRYQIIRDKKSEARTNRNGSGQD